MRHLLATALLTLWLPNSASAAPVISEFLASNSSGLQDEDGDRSDWIEIHNPDPTPVDLDDWALTDNALDPDKWTFPALTLQPGDYLVVFASTKNRSVAGSELHTDFSLDKNGEYLALISPLGLISTEFSPAYPPQRNDLSYGTSDPTTEVTLLADNAPARARVPDLAYDILVGTSWRDNDPLFDDSSWSSGTLGVGYDTSPDFDPLIGLDVQTQALNTNTTVYIRAAIPGTLDPATISTLTLRMKYDDGFAAFINGEYAIGANDPTPLLWSSPSTLGVADEDAEMFQDFDITASIPDLEASGNILAIHGLNRTLGSSDFLIRPMIVARVADPSILSGIGYLSPPSPGTINGDTAYAEVLTDTRFDIGRGFFDTPFTERLSSTDPGATLIYTLDGSIPSPTNGIQVLPPDPLTPPAVILPITTTTILRAVAIKANALSTNVDTQTYLFPADVLLQDGTGLPSPPNSTSTWDYEMDPAVVNDPRYPNLVNDLKSLPSLSVVLPNEDVWGPDGVYANPKNRGFAWERACSAEIINPDGSPGTQIDAGLRLHGSGSRNRAIGKKSMRLAFRKLYGKSKFDYPLWGSGGPSGIGTLVLRGSYFDSWTFQADSGSADGITRSNALQFRTHFATIAHARTGQETIASNWVHLYINGQYWGPYNTHERPDDEFAELHFGGDEDDYTVIKTNVELVNGSLTDWNSLMALCNPYNASNHQAILDSIDQDQFIDYIFMNIWGGNDDWPHNNWYAMRNDTLGGPFLFHVWDPENYVYTTTANRTGVANNNTPGIVYDRLRRNLEFQVRFGDRVHKHMFNDGPYTQANMEHLWQATADELQPAMNCEAARWGDEFGGAPYNTIDHYLPHVAYRKDTYMPVRHNLVLSQLRSKNLYPNTEAPTLSPHGGQAPAGSPVFVSNPNDDGVQYFTTDGSDPRLPGGSINPNALSTTDFLVTAPLTARARILSASGEWSALTEATFLPATDPTTGELVISELHYHPNDATPIEQAAGFTNQDHFEFLELMNVGPNAVDLSKLAFTAGITFDFSTLSEPSDRILAAGERLLLVNNLAAFTFRYGSLPVIGEYSGALDNGGETITLTLNATTDILTFSYIDDSPWPEPSDGDGYSLVLSSPGSGLNLSDPANWQPSATSNGSPGTSDTALFTGNPIGDDNNDGLPNLLHFAMTNGSAPPPALSINFWILDPGTGPDTYPTLTFQRNLSANLTLVPEASSDLTTWTPLTADPHLLEISHQGDGTALYTYRAPSPSSASELQFFRLRALTP